MVGWVNIVTVVAMVAAPLPPAGARSAIELDALATLRYKSAQTEAVAARIADAQLVAMRSKIDSGDRQLAQTRGQLATLRAGVRADKAKIASLEQQADALLADLTALKNGFTEELASRDAQYARDIAVLQTAGEQLLATPEGIRALDLYNAGGPGAFEAADAVLGAVEKERDQAREAAAKKQLADDRRSRATLALDARDKGLTTTTVAIERWEGVVAADPSGHWDWIKLAELYSDAGRIDKAQDATEHAAATAIDDRDRMVAQVMLGRFRMLRGDTAGAATAVGDGVKAARRLAADGSDAGRIDLAIALNN
jgi:tetratricopeptide (TPR) repeat protein